jgi:phosphoserine phosphatase RsbU/P
MRTLGTSIYNYNNALGFFTNALRAIEERNFDLRLLNDLMYPVPELINFSQAFRRIAEQIVLRQARNREMDSAAAIQRAFLPDPISMSSHISNVDIFAKCGPQKRWAETSTTSSSSAGTSWSSRSVTSSTRASPPLCSWQ